MNVYELDIDKFQTVLPVLSKLSNVVDNDVFKTTVCVKKRRRMLIKKYLILVNLLRLKTLRLSNKLLLRY